MKDLFKKVRDFATEISAEREGDHDGVAIIITALDTTVKPEDGESNLTSLIIGKGIELVPLLGEMLDNKTLKPLITHAVLANILMSKNSPSEPSESKKEN